MFLFIFGYFIAATVYLFSVDVGTEPDYLESDFEEARTKILAEISRLLATNSEVTKEIND